MHNDPSPDVILAFRSRLNVVCFGYADKLVDPES